MCLTTKLLYATQVAFSYIDCFLSLNQHFLLVRIHTVLHQVCLIINSCVGLIRSWRLLVGNHHIMTCLVAGLIKQEGSHCHIYITLLIFLSTILFWEYKIELNRDFTNFYMCMRKTRRKRKKNKNEICVWLV